MTGVPHPVLVGTELQERLRRRTLTARQKRWIVVGVMVPLVAVVASQVVAPRVLRLSRTCGFEPIHGLAHIGDVARVTIRLEHGALPSPLLPGSNWSSSGHATPGLASGQQVLTATATVGPHLELIVDFGHGVVDRFTVSPCGARA